MSYVVSVEDDPRPVDVRVIEHGLDQHALPVTRTPGFQPVAVFARDERGVVVGGVVARVNWNWLHVNLVWVAEPLRRTGLGRRLMAEIEKVAVERGCTHAHLDTFSYQARPFYERQGYEVFGTLENYPPGQRRFFMQKALARTALALVLGMLVLAGPVSAVAQGRSRAEAIDFLVYLQSVAARRTAQVCERGMEAYKVRFDDLYGRWSTHHADRITRGEARFVEALANKNLARSERAKLEEVEKALDELAQPPRPASPITLTDSMREVCEENLRELEKPLDP